MRKTSNSPTLTLTFIAVLVGLAASVDISGNASRAVAKQQATTAAFLLKAGL